MNIEDKANAAIDRANKVNYTLGTEGWGIIKAEIDKEIKWGFEKSVSLGFRDEVKDNPAVYFEHYGYINGLKQLGDIINKINVAAETAGRDLKKWESQKSRHISKASQIKSLAK